MSIFAMNLVISWEWCSWVLVQSHTSSSPVLIQHRYRQSIPPVSEVTAQYK